MTCDDCGKYSHALINQEGCKGEIGSSTMRMKNCFRDKQMHESRKDCCNCYKWSVRAKS